MQADRTWSRRAFLAAGVAALPRLVQADELRSRMGVVIHSYPIRSAAERGSAGKLGFTDPLVFAEHCRQLGAGGVQIGLGVRDREYVARLRERLESAGMYLEGSIRLPRDEADVDRFAAEVRTAREAGASVLRTVALSGRRYETFETAAAFRAWARAAEVSLRLAEGVVARQKVRLAVENHKDWRVEELVALLERLGSPHFGVCVDTGNSIALLEDPYEIVEAYAPWAFTVHLKDMAVAEYDEGFLLSEVPLGEGFLALPRLVAALRKARPEVRFGLEMITRDPLRIPCLTPKYWVTFEHLPGRQLARALTLVRHQAAKQPLPRVSGLSRELQLVVEEENVRRSFAYARQQLGF